MAVTRTPWPGPGPKHHASVKYDLPLSQIDSRLVVVLHQRKISLMVKYIFA